MEKDCTFYELVELLEGYAQSLNKEHVINQLSSIVQLGFLDRRTIFHGQPLKEGSIRKLAKSSGIATDAIKIVSNTTTIAASIFKLFGGG